MARGAISDIESQTNVLAESLFELSSIPEIEELVCTRLESLDSYEFAWISGEADNEVVISTESGVEDDPSNSTPALEEGPSQEIPIAEAHETGEVQVVQNVQGDSRYESCHNRPNKYDYQALASVPIAYDGDGNYGALNVYTSRENAFNQEERDALRRLSSIIAYAIRAVERDRELRRECDRVEFMNRLLRHNLLNSLNVVEGRLDLLENRVDYEASNHLETAVERTSEMIDFVEMIHKVTKIISPQNEKELRPVALGDVLVTRVTRAREIYPDAEFHLEQVPSVEVVADDLFGEVLDNILINAVQHNGSESPTVWVETTVTNAEVVVSVADNGPGIPHDEGPDAFDRHVKDPGSGFGLYLVEEIIDSYGGSIDVTDSAPGGTRFKMTFQRT